MYIVVSKFGKVYSDLLKSLKEAQKVQRMYPESKIYEVFEFGYISELVSGEC